ncbi:MAG: hypothetical protein EZS28_024641 [Streblomastix strix]|uniref:Uncharacterized protein n=1 Tax=Streblomastix strix TaxID=222440 RepID=A0A5J4VBK7_9EUKA|nr:MAG: hypothetical protein EZS28_024641 [Streblomastix strix]
MRAPGRFQLMGIQNRTREEIHTLEIFLGIYLREHCNFSQTQEQGKTIRYLETWKLVNGVEYIQKGFFLLFKNEDSEKRLQEILRICSFSGSRENEIAHTENLEQELRDDLKEQIHPDQTK